MKHLPHADRELLQGLRICRPYENGVSLIDGIASNSPRVLIPTRLKEWFEKAFKIGGLLIETDWQTLVLKIALSKVGAAYRRRSHPESGPNYYNCSTFTMAVFAQIGIELPRFAIDQSYSGTTIIRLAPASLAFFENHYPIADPDRKIGHVGIVTKAGKLIHASYSKGAVVCEKLTQTPLVIQDVIPEEAHTLVVLPLDTKGAQTALDLLRRFQDRRVT